MSRSIFLKIPTTISLTGEDTTGLGKTNKKFQLLGILSPGEMKQLLKGCLEKGGWKAEEGAMTLDTPRGGKAKIDMEKLEVEVDVSHLIQKEISQTIYHHQDRGPNITQEITSVEDLDKLNLTAAEKQTLSKSIGGIQEKVKELIVRETLVARDKLNEAIKEVYREAVKQKAQKLGNIVSTSEDQSGGMRLRVIVAE